MKKRKLTLADIILIGSTRGMLGAGIGLFLADKLNDSQRRAVGWTLVMVGVITTIPLVINVLSQDEELSATIPAQFTAANPVH